MSQVRNKQSTLLPEGRRWVGGFTQLTGVKSNVLVLSLILHVCKFQR